MADRSRATKPKRPWYRRWWMFLLVLPLLVVLPLGLLAFFVVFSSVDLPEDIAAEASVVLDVDGEEVGALSEQANREDHELSELPEHVPQAVMGAEDREFYDHSGISFTGIARALFTNVRAGEIEEGGSTITQQYVKYTEAGTEQTYTRKVREAAMAIKLERAYSKDEILEFYLNTAYWGRGAYGVGAAADAYFDKPATDLSVNEAATLAGLLTSPENLDPLEATERADERRRYTLDGMAEQGWIERDRADELIEAGLPEVIERRRADQGPNAWYLDAVRRELAQAPAIDDEELFQGLTIHTALDQDLQAAAQQVVAQTVADGPTNGGSIVSIDPASGGVRALVGGPDISEDQNNVAMSSVRQPGSTFKPFTLLGFTRAGYSPESRFDAPAQITVDDGSDEGYTAHNYGSAAYGEQTVYQATTSSTNTVYVQMQEEIGGETVVEAAGAAGLPTTTDEQPYPTSRGDDWTMSPYPALTLGTEEVSPLELTSAYATLAAEGVHVTPHLVTEVENRDGETIHRPNIAEEQDVSANEARVVTEAMRRNVESGTGTAAQLGRPTAGKTGTTQNYTDAWFAGYVPQLATAAWFGNVEGGELEGSPTGGGLAAPAWGEYMRQAVEGMDVVDFVRPDLSDLEILNEEPAECPDGYAFADPPAEVDEDGWYPDVRDDITNDEGQPCVEEEPEPQCPDGYAFADPPSDDAEPMPDVDDSITNDEGQPCVEQDPEPAEQCPDGYAFADPPSDDAEPMPDVDDSITNDEGQPCVEQNPEPADDDGSDGDGEDGSDGDGSDDGSGDDGGDSGSGDGSGDGSTDDGSDDGSGDGAGGDGTDDGAGDGSTDDGSGDGGASAGTDEGDDELISGSQDGSSGSPSSTG